MKALSIWQPWASLIMAGHKKIETRSWAVPYSIQGQRIAIASTKAIRGEQRRAAEQQGFRKHYAATGLAGLANLPLGSVLGTVIVDGCREMDSEFLAELDEQEEAFGICGPGRFAWLLIRLLHSRRSSASLAWDLRLELPNAAERLRWSLDVRMPIDDPMEAGDWARLSPSHGIGQSADGKAMS